MRKIEPASFVGERPWQALDIEAIEDATVPLHWTDRPYRWHVNDGPEVFVPLDGSVTMHYRRAGQEHCLVLGPGDICHAEAGDEHFAEPHGTVRILVIEKAGSP
ncbi:cupin [Caldimonas sp.]|uniref:cupin n=1 Tax=Caldimonas sp. TaxID=2838790 RepID=UPI00391B8DE5